MRPRHLRHLLLCFTLAALAAGDLAAAKRKVPKSKTEDQLSFGVTMARRGLWSEALFRFRRANQERPNDGRILNNMAVAFEAVGRFDEALASYQQALKADPGNKELRRNYSRFVEFYQGFKPPEEGEGGESEAASDAQPAAEDGSAGNR